ncbi:hypothetical protein FOA52_015635 [Chlamydomonas sp. UWO 241]|nr:hypothetical protein FOA52_015635 [Chlamydomonas sp. UWO 241]
MVPAWRVSIMFVDIVGFTEMSNELQPHQVLEYVNLLFQGFDSICNQHKVYNLDTAGDCYIVIASLMKTDEEGFSTIDPEPDPVAGAHALLDAARALMRHAHTVPMPHNGQLTQIRIGMHTGSVVSGLTGAKNLKFSIYGDAMNTSSRMESTGKAGCIHISEATYALLEGAARACFRPTGGVQVKGKGLMHSYSYCPADGNHELMLAELDSINACTPNTASGGGGAGLPPLAPPLPPPLLPRPLPPLLRPLLPPPLLTLTLLQPLPPPLLLQPLLQPLLLLQLLLTLPLLQPLLPLLPPPLLQPLLLLLLLPLLACKSRSALQQLLQAAPSSNTSASAVAAAVAAAAAAAAAAAVAIAPADASSALQQLLPEAPFGWLAAAAAAAAAAGAAAAAAAAGEPGATAAPRRRPVLRVELSKPEDGHSGDTGGGPSNDGGSSSQSISRTATGASARAAAAASAWPPLAMATPSYREHGSGKGGALHFSGPGGVTGIPSSSFLHKASRPSAAMSAGQITGGKAMGQPQAEPSRWAEIRKMNNCQLEAYGVGAGESRPGSTLRAIPTYGRRSAFPGPSPVTIAAVPDSDDGSGGHDDSDGVRASAPSNATHDAEPLRRSHTHNPCGSLLPPSHADASAAGARMATLFSGAGRRISAAGTHADGGGGDDAREPVAPYMATMLQLLYAHAHEKLLSHGRNSGVLGAQLRSSMPCALRAGAAGDGAHGSPGHSRSSADPTHMAAAGAHGGGGAHGDSAILLHGSSEHAPQAGAGLQQAAAAGAVNPEARPQPSKDASVDASSGISGSSGSQVLPEAQAGPWRATEGGEA